MFPRNTRLWKYTGSSRHVFVKAMLALLAFGSTLATAADFDLKADLEQIASLRVLFGHQSVGANVIDGIKQLAQAEGVPLRIAEVQTTAQVGPATFGHVYVAENGKPSKKLASFESAIDHMSSDPDVAFLKFCFVDFSADTDVAALFAQYQATIGRLKIRHPKTTFVHVTVPLTIVQNNFKVMVKRMFGRAPPGVMENWRRDEYNRLLRQAYAGHEPIFDIAHIESRRPNGEDESTNWDGRSIPALAPEYSSDGGHLNAAGQQRAARELVHIVASITRGGMATNGARKP